MLDSLVLAERAFSHMSVERGMKAAFLEFLAADGIIFGPGPLKGREVWRARGESKATLIWEPSYAEVAAAGDLGLSLGPWELRPPPGTDAATLHGHFISVWRRREAEPWRVACDLGVVHEAPAQGLGKVKFVAGPQHVPRSVDSPRFGWSVGASVSRRHGFGIGIGSYVAPSDDDMPRIAHAIHEMMTADRTYAFELKRTGEEAALRAVAADDVRRFRSGPQPAFGIDAAAAAVAAEAATRAEWKPTGRGMSASLDLGYSYGLVLRRARGAARPDTSAYMRVWRNLDGKAWQLVADVENPFPKR